ncbi:calpain-A-like isoform X1 [Diorhabda sublineata]|uniref:calpain-A-like isoform X1 n=1 Tax=Diorhabda sublineata TaxID=1163346 RepID=UPI0024E16F37|nr:calpain-A-like isoform X1 [Diorhabda sublineata]
MERVSVTTTVVKSSYRVAPADNKSPTRSGFTEGGEHVDQKRSFKALHSAAKSVEIYREKASLPVINESRKISTLESVSETEPKKISASGLNTLYKFGEKGSGTRSKTGGVQDFYQLRDECLANGTLFEDPEFPATDTSLFFSEIPDRTYEWRRPHEICTDPKFFVEGFSRFDVQQGILGDCWLLAATANLTLHSRLFFQIVPDDQEFDDKYAGIFHFRFWQYGKWIDIVIDDRLPTYRGELIFLHSTEENEFWSALLEKAYAKLNGSYEALKGGSTCEAMEDFTGGVSEMYEMESAPPNLFQIILKAYERCSLMGCSIEPDPNVLEAHTPQGLIRGHAYSITRVKYVEIHTPNVSGKIPLLRLRNPWGNEDEWNGPWSDEAPEWRFISQEEKEELGLTFDKDGEFWMSFKDFMKNFSRLEICNLNPDSLSEAELEEEDKKKWEMSVFEGEWVRGVTAGGCRNFLTSFWHNPQYRITLTDVDEDDDENKCTMIVALMQKNRRQLRQSGADLLTIGFAIYHLSYPDRLPKPLDLNFFKYNASVARSPSFVNLREVSCRFKLPPGTYCIVPSTFDPNEEGEFLLRVFTEKQNVMEEHDDDVGFGEVEDSANTEPSEEEKEEFHQVYEFFLRLAGEDKEVDWMELKDILDYSLKSDRQRKKIISTEPKTTVNDLNEAPNKNSDDVILIKKIKRIKDPKITLPDKPPQEVTTTTSTANNNNSFTSCLALFCGTLCKGTPLADLLTSKATETPLRSALTVLKVDGFSKDVCRSMISMLDTDKSGKLGFVEFTELWDSIRQWKNVWMLYDKDQSGTFSGFELRQALNSAGFRLNNKILNILMHRYGNRNGEMDFEDFMMCAIKLKTMIELFKKKQSNSTRNASFSIDEWLENTLYS